jgi:uncharacterized membrane protein YdjX (TVP38/TMEM64 family)
MEGKTNEQTSYVGLGIVILVLIALAFFIDIDDLKGWVLQAGIWAPLAFILIKISTIVIAPLSGSPLYPLVGLLFGFWPGVLLVLIGDFLGYTISFFISRIFGRKAVLKLISGKEEGMMARIMNHVGEPKGFFHACLTCFGMPEILSYSAGLSKLPYPKFISILLPITTVVTSILVFIGSVIDPKNSSLYVGLLLPALGMVVAFIGISLFIRGIKKE